MIKNKKRFSFKNLFEEKSRKTKTEGRMFPRENPDLPPGPFFCKKMDYSKTAPKRNPVSEMRRLAIRKKIKMFGLPEIIAMVKRKKRRLAIRKKIKKFRKEIQHQRRGD